MRIGGGFLIAFLSLGGLTWSVLGHAASDLTISVVTTSAETNREAGDLASYDITVTNIGDSPAFDVVVTDTQPPEFQNCLLNGTTNGSGAGDPFVGGFTFTSFGGITPNALDPGDNVVLDVRCNLEATILDSTTYTNQASVVWANSLGGPTLPAVIGSDTVSTRPILLQKGFIASSEAHTNVFDNPLRLVAGEIVRYRVWAHVLQGTVQNFTLTDLLPAGLAYVPGNRTLVGLVSNSGSDLQAAGLVCGSGTPARVGDQNTDLSTLGLDCVISPSSGGVGSGSDPVFSFGNVLNTEHDGGLELIVLEFNARVVGDTTANTVLPNVASVTSTSATTNSGAANVVHHEPVLAITKDVVQPSVAAGTRVEYVVTIRHDGTSTENAYDIVLGDVLPANLTYDGLSGITGPQPPVSPGGDTCTAAGLVINDADPNGTGLSISFAGLPTGEVCEIRYFATTNAGLSAGTQIINTSTVNYSSLPLTGTTPNPTGSPPGTEGTWQRQDTATVTIEVPTVLKRITTTSLPETPDNTADTVGDPRPSTIGERVRYRLQTRIPEGSLTGATITDQLPAGMIYVAGTARVALVSDSNGITATPALSCTSGTAGKSGNDTTIVSVAPDCAVEPTGGPFVSGTDPVWNLGNLNTTDGDGNAEYALIEYEAVVANELSGQDGVVLSGPYGLVSGAFSVASNVVASVIREAHVLVTITANPNPVDNRTAASPVTRFTALIENDGTAAGFQIGAPTSGGYSLTLPQNIGGIVPVSVLATGNVFRNGTATTLSTADLSVTTTLTTGDTLALGSLLQMAAGATLRIEFDATLQPAVTTGATLNGSTSIAYASLPAGTELNETRTDASLATGAGNAPLTSNAALNDYRSEGAFTISTLAEAPAIDIVHDVSAGPADIGGGQHTLTYRLTITNAGDVDLDNLSLQDSLDATFGAGNYSISAVRVTSPGNSLLVDPAFAGTPSAMQLLLPASTLAAGVSGVVEVDLVVQRPTGTYGNSATVSGRSVRSAAVVNDTDNSDVLLTSNNALLGLAKAASTSAANLDGTFSSTITLTMTNMGTEVLSNIGLVDDIAARIAPAQVTRVQNVTISGALSALNPAFNGSTNTELLARTQSLAAAASATITFTLVFNPNNNTGPFQNLAVASGESPGNPTPGTPNVTDTSTNGLNPDPDGNGVPGDNSVPTPITYIPGANGSVDITDQSIPGDPLQLVVIDADVNTDPATPQSITVVVVNNRTGEQETRSLTETGPNTGRFENKLPTLFGANAGTNNDGRMNTRKDDTVTINYSDQLGSNGGVTPRSDTGVVVGVAGIAGNSWLDANQNGVFDSGETPLTGWTIRVLRNDVPVADVLVAADGSYVVTGLTPGDGYSVTLLHPESGASYELIDNITLAPETVVIDQNMPIDPSGIIFDSVTRTPIAGVTVTMVSATSGTPLPAACLLAGQQAQRTGADGFYRFDLLLGARPECPSGSTFLIVPAAPAGYNAGYSVSLPPQPSALDPTGLPDPVRVGSSPQPPAAGLPVNYFVSFVLADGDPNIVWNHVPLDPVSVASSGVQLNKQAEQRSTTVGGLVVYTLTITNNTPLALPGVSIVDQLPAGFSYVEGSATLVDGGTLLVSGTRPVTFAGFDLAPGQVRQIRYVTRVSAGVVHGEYLNTATPFVGPAPAGASAQARVTVIADPDFEETTIIGKVFNDVDGDGWQDSAAATDVKLWVWTEGGEPESVTLQIGANEPVVVPGSLTGGLELGDLAGRYGVNDRSGRNSAEVALDLPSEARISRVEVQSREGTRLILSGNGSDEQHHRLVAGGTNGQAMVVRLESERSAGAQRVRVRVINNGVDEQGLPGVRLATVEGLLIETDAFGRFHLAGVDGGFMERGRNFIMKVDPATLPPGTEFVSENPRVLRLSQGLMNQFDFAVRVPTLEHKSKRLTVKIAEMFFKPGSAVVLPGYREMLATLARELRQGAYVNLWVEAYTDGQMQGDAAAALARRRADALIKALCEMAGDDVSKQIEIHVAPAGEAVGLIDTVVLPWLAQAMDLMLDAMIPGAVAESADRCLADVCRDQSGIPVVVIENEDGSMYAPSAELDDHGRADLLGEQVVRLTDGGVIWWTEDPAALAPRLTLIGPAHIPLRDGMVAEDVEFLIYSNYSAFVDEFSIDIHSAEDTDLVRPIAQLRIDNKTGRQQMHRLDWAVKGTRLASGDAINYVLRAVDAQGHEDRTHVQKALLIEGGALSQQRLKARADADAIHVGLGLIDQGVTIFLPGKDHEQVLAHTAHFTDFGIDLNAQDRVALDAMVEALRAASRVELKVHGHTSTKRIAPRSRPIIPDNDALSKRRARVVADYLRKGLGDRVQDSEELGSGPNIPVAENITEAGQALNRRAEATIRGHTPLADDQVTSVPRALTAGHSGDAISGIGYGLALARNDLAARSIPIYGSRVRVQGDHLGDGLEVVLRGESFALDDDGQFAAEYLLPVGKHVMPLVVTDGEGNSADHQLAVDVTGRYQFLVALADITLSDSSISGAIEPLQADDRYDGNMLLEGRLAFYLKGKIQGKYLVTAQLDTREEELEDLFDNIHRKDAQSLFRRLDPDQYYPVYGDDSTTIADVNTHGRMYARLEWDRSEAVWGNFETGLTGNEVIQYSRGLYGARGHYNSLGVTKFGDTKTSVTAFGSENQTALGHSEFLGTGGSLYYLRHTDLLPGSDKTRIEIRDPRSNRVIDNRPLQQGLDYEIDELQGRLILTRPLMQLAQASAPSLISEGTLAGNEVVLVVDYEYVPDQFDTNQIVVGGNARQWIGNHVAIGATVVDEARGGDDYTLGGVDVTVKAAENTWARVEYGQSESTQAERFVSTDGGLSFRSVNAGLLDRKGDAASMDIHVNAGDFGGPVNWITNVWAKDVDDEYSVARRDDGANVKEAGVETQLPVGENWKVGARASHYEVTSLANEDRVALTVARKIGERGVLTAEAQHAQTRVPVIGNTDATLGAVQYEHRLTDQVSVYGGGQAAIDSSSGYDNNDQVHLGTRVTINDDTQAEVEVRDGHRGTGAVAGMEHRLNSAHTLYGTVTHSTDTTEDPFLAATSPSLLDTIGTNYTVGHRWAMNDRAQLFTEGQFNRGPEGTGLGSAFGLDYALPRGWYAGFTLQDTHLQTVTGEVERSAYSVGGGHTGDRHRYSSRLEYREDDGAGTSSVQWLTTNRVDFRLTQSYRAAAKLNFSRTKNRLTNQDDGRLIEGSAGVAYRPVGNNRLNWFSKYTWLHDLQSIGQENAQTDRRLQVLSWEGILRLHPQFDIGLKLARREGEVRLLRDGGRWFGSDANFAAGNVRWHVMRNWDALAEYRWLDAESDDSQRSGFLISLDRHITDNFRLGVGYSFVDFSDDLTNVDYDFKGWFVNAVGKY